MNVIVGHTNMDLDCIGSMVLAGYLYPDHVQVRSHLIHPVAKNLYNLYAHQLAFSPAKDLKGRHIEEMVVVDTRSYGRLREYFDMMKDPPESIVVYDHHERDSADLPDAVIHERECGANTTLLGLSIMERRLGLSADDATVALIGLYADTGRFAHPSVRPEDFQVAAYLLEHGASIEITEHLLRSLRENHQIDLFHVMLNNLVHRNINGHSVLLSYLELEENRTGLSAVVEKVFEVEDTDALFSVFGFRKQHSSIIIGRSRKDAIDLARLLEAFGGGGHTRAASAILKDLLGAQVLDTLTLYLERTMEPAVTAARIMSTEVAAICEDWDLRRASVFLEDTNHTGSPVVGPDGGMTGFLTLRDIMKGRRADQMNAPVKAYMTRKKITISPDTTIREIEDLMFAHNIGHLPVENDGHLTGIVTRSDLIRFFKKHQKRSRLVLEDVRQSVGEDHGGESS